MPVRPAAVAGRFYPGDAASLGKTVQTCLARSNDAAAPEEAVCVMVPHAGYIFSGQLAGQTLASVRLPKTVLILAPNHTGLGRSRFGVWPQGPWETPLGDVAVNSELAARLAARPPFAPDTLCHMRDHAIEVQLPFLQMLAQAQGQDFDIVPVCVASLDPVALQEAGLAIAAAFGEELRAGSLGILVSSDMNHFENEANTRSKDELALQYVLAEDPQGLVATCRANNITMCGAGPMAMALHALKDLRATPARSPWLVGHTTSGATFGDYDRVVGYAGVRFYW